MIWNAATQKLCLLEISGGINISPKLLFHLNFHPLIQTIEDDLQRRMNLPLALIGRIATIKMSILPKKLSVYHDPNSTHHQLVNFPRLNNYQILLEK